MFRPSLLSAGLATALALCVWGSSDGTALPLALASAVDEGLSQLEGQVNAPTGTADFRQSLGDAIRYVVTFVALAAVVTIIVAGFILIFGLGTESSMQRTKKIFIYTLVGVLIIFFVRVIVGFFTEELAGSFND